MSNLDAAMGFSPVRNPHGNTIPANEYEVTASNAVAPGTILYLTDAGTVQAYLVTTTATGYLNIIGAAMGSVASAATDRTVLVADHPDQEFEVQVDDNSVTTATDLIGAGFNSINAGTVQTTLIQDRGEIDGSSATTINTSTYPAPFIGLRFSKSIENDETATHCKIIVKIRSDSHIFGSGPAVL